MSSNAIDSTDAATGLTESITDQTDSSSTNSSQSNSSQSNSSQKGPTQMTPSQPTASAEEWAALEKGLATGILKKQLPAIRKLTELGPDGEARLVTFVRSRMNAQNDDVPTAAHGSAYQYLYQGTSPIAKAFVAEEFPDGLVCPQSAQGVDYSDLQMLLIKRQYEEADKLTNQKLCELAGDSAIARKWVYFTDVELFPALDLIAMDIMWGLYSENKFGWSKQHELWTRLGKDWDRLWPQLNWKNGNTWTRYPNGFVWDLSAPVGHMPLSNQLRGVRTMNALLSHPAWG